MCACVYAFVCAPLCVRVRIVLPMLDPSAPPAACRVRQVAKPQSAERFIRTVSRRGAPNTVTFSHVDLVPAVLRGVAVGGGSSSGGSSGRGDGDAFG